MFKEFENLSVERKVFKFFKHYKYYNLDYKKYNPDYK